MQKLDFGNQKKQREFTGHLFKEQRIYVGDLVKYRKNKYWEIGEVQKRNGVYLVGGKPLEDLEIIRVLDMSGIGVDGRYV
jgi:hypothetical protein